MPYVEGESLRQRLLPRGRLPLERRLRIARRRAGRALLRPRARDRAPRHQAGEHPAGGGRGGPGRLRHRPGSECRGLRAADRDRTGDGHSGLHEPGAGRRARPSSTAAAICTRSAACSTSASPASRPSPAFSPMRSSPSISPPPPPLSPTPWCPHGSLKRSTRRWRRVPTTGSPPRRQFTAALGTKGSDKPAARRLPLISRQSPCCCCSVSRSMPAAESLLAVPRRRLHRVRAQPEADPDHLRRRGGGVAGVVADGTRLAYVAETDGFKQLFVRTLCDRGRAAGFTFTRATTFSRPGRPTDSVWPSCEPAPSGGKLEPSDINGWYDEGGDIWIGRAGRPGGRRSLVRAPSIRPTRRTGVGSPSMRAGRAPAGSGLPTAAAATRARSRRTPARPWCTPAPAGLPMARGWFFAGSKRSSPTLSSWTSTPGADPGHRR